ncbi:MAG: hypothetical protein RLZ81_1686 [Pseudomonadota bacterium]|jgi:hypothetical protein
MSLRYKLKWIALGCATLLLLACGGASDGGNATSVQGTLRLALTDAPACGYEAVNLTVRAVRVHQSRSAADTDGGWSEVALNPPRRLNLLNLRGGVLEELGQTPLPVGKYTQLRMVLADNDASHPLANSVLPSADAETALKTPSGQQSGVKANIDIDIAANQLADFVIDFDACRSVVTLGNSQQYLLKPVLTVMARYVAGVSGFVADALANGSTSVSLQQGAAVIKATTPEVGGKFLLQPVAPGSYTLVVTAPGRRTGVVTGVVVAADAVTPLNSAATALSLPASASATVQGSAPVDTLVRIVQPLSGGPGIEVAGRFVDAVTGRYAYPLVVDAPQRAAYVAPAGALVFVADGAAAGKYTLAASLAGFGDRTLELPMLTADAVVNTNLTFP